MAHESPFRGRHEEYVRSLAERNADQQNSSSRPGAATGHRLAGSVEYLPYGPEEKVEIVATFGSVETEYAAIRNSTAMADVSQRGTLFITGNDRLDFLNRLVTQDVKTLQPGSVARAFLLNRKGRIEADLVLIDTGDKAIIDVDIHQVATTEKVLNDFLFSEDVQIANQSMTHIQIRVPDRHTDAISQVIGELSTCVYQSNITGEPECVVIIERDKAVDLWDELVNEFRPVGWYAFNIARIEAGSPLMNIDFGANNLPHETGVVYDRVSFKKGCYPGQEVVARMENLGKPKQKLVGLRMKEDKLPVGGAQVFARTNDGSMGDEIGVITSSTISPMLSASPIAFAMIRSAHIESGKTVLVNAEGEQVSAVVGPLQFLSTGAKAES